MDTKTYEKQMESMLGDRNTYEILRKEKDPDIITKTFTTK